MTNLHNSNIGYNKFCGPAVLAILTGKSTDECASVISHINGQYTVTGVQLPHLLKAAEKLGFINEQVDVSNSLFSSIRKLITKDGLYIVTLPKHFVVIETSGKKAYFCDNHTKEPIQAENSARLGMKVVACHRVWEKPKPVLLNTELDVDFVGETVYIKRFYNHINTNDDYETRIGELRTLSKDDILTVAHKLIEITNEQS